MAVSSGSEKRIGDYEEYSEVEDILAERHWDCGRVRWVSATKIFDADFGWRKHREPFPDDRASIVIAGECAATVSAVVQLPVD